MKTEKIVSGEYCAPEAEAIELVLEQAVFQGSGSFNIPGFREEPGI